MFSEQWKMNILRFINNTKILLIYQIINYKLQDAYMIFKYFFIKYQNLFRHSVLYSYEMMITILKTWLIDNWTRNNKSHKAYNG